MMEIRNYHQDMSDKTLLAEKRDIYLASMEQELAELGGKAKKAGAATLIIGGICVVGFLLARKFIFPKKEKSYKKILLKHPSTELMVKQPKTESRIVTMIKEQMALFLIAILKEKLTSYLNSLETKK